MYYFGDIALHAHAIRFGDIAAMDAPTEYTIAVQLHPTVSISGGTVFSKRELGGDTLGWNIYVNALTPTIFHQDAGGSDGAAATSDLIVNTTSLVVATWDGSNAKFWIEGVAAGAPALARAIDNTIAEVTIGNQDNVGAMQDGFPGKVGQVFWWDEALDDGEAAGLYGGFFPRLDALKFWCPCIVDPDRDHWGGATGVKTGTVTIALDSYKSWYWPFHSGKHGGFATAATTEPTIGKTPGLELDLPGGTKYYASPGVTAHGLAQYKGKVMSWGGVSRSVSEHDNSLTRPELVITIDDNDKEFAHIVEGASGNEVRGSVARAKLLGSGLDPWTEFTGKLNSWDQGAPHVYALSLRQDDMPLERMFPKTRITQFDWHDADASAIGQYVPIILGIHDSTGDSDNGMVPTYYVDHDEYLYLVAGGYLKDVSKVYVNGGETGSGNYSITHPVVNGRQYTLIDFVSDQGTDVITADVEGYETAGDGTGEVITNPVRQLNHVLENFNYGDYETGSWLTGNAPIDDETFGKAANFADQGDYEGAIYIAGDQIKGRDFVNTWLASFDARGYWERTGDLAVLFLDHGERTLYKDGNSWIRWEQNDAGFGIRQNVDGITSRITIRYTKNSAEDQLKQTIEVRDPSIDEETADGLDQEYGPARVT